MKRNFFVFILYGILSLFFIRGILLSPGIIIGSDWSLPLTSLQMKVFGEQGFYTWTNSWSLLGARLSHLNIYPFNFFVLLLSKIGFNGAVFSKILLVFLLSLIGFSAFYFCRKIGLSFKSSLLAGFIYLTTPLVFNYSIMGWIFILLIMAIIPFFLFAFKLSVEKEKVGYSIIAGLLFAIAMFQSQAAFWLPLLMIISFPFLVFSKRRLFLFVRSLLTIFFIVLAIHANWILPLIFTPDPQIAQAVSAYDIQRFEIRLSFVNMLRLWGGLFNYQFEMVYPRVLLPVSFTLPFFAFLAVVLRKKNKKVLHLAVIALLPLIIYSLRNVFYHLPFSIIIRDFGRMMILSAFPYSVLVAITFEEIGKLRGKFVSKFLCAVVILLVFLNSLPFWTGELYGESKIDHDQRLRTLEFPREYHQAEELLLKDKKDTKALYLPSGLFLGFLDNKRFYGPYKEAADIFGILSSKPGAFAFSDKTTGPSVDYGKLILNAIEDGKKMEFRNLLKLTSIDSFVIRKNVYVYGAGGKGPEIEKMIESLPNIERIFDSPKLSIFKNNNFLPHFYIPQNIVYSNVGIEDLIDIVSFGDYEIESGIYLANKADNADETLITSIEKADEVFVKAGLENVIDERYFQKKESFKNSVPFPYVKHRPGSLGWRLARLKERYYEWRVRKDPEKWIEKKLFYAGKRISELEEFADNADERLRTLIRKLYQTKMEEVIEEIEKSRDLAIPEIWEERVIKLRAYWERHKERIEEMEGLENWEKVFGELDEEIKPLEKKFDLKNLEYSFEVLKKGEYELFVKAENSERELIKRVGMVIDKDIVATETARIREDNWISFGKRNFQEGSHNLILHLSEPENLVGKEWQELKLVEKIEEGIALSPQKIFPQEQKVISQPIRDWQKNGLYYLSFDYKTEVGSLSVSVLEETTGYQEEKEIVQRKKIFEQILRSKKEGKQEKFETILRAKGNTLGARIYLYGLADPGQIAKADFKNLVIYKLVQPKVVLRMKVDNAEKRWVTPRITFEKVNPTKYRIKVKGAEEPYTLVFSESFHPGWKAWVAENTDRNADNTDIVASYFDGEIKEGTHRNAFLEKATFETWGKEPISEDKHLLVNGYANAWYLEPSDTGGAENYELIIEFLPQRLFYIGLAISGLTLVGCLGYLGYNFLKKRK